MKKYEWIRINSKYICKDKWISLRADECKMPDGKIIKPYYVLEYPDWVNVVAITKNKEIILTKQYRYAYNKISLELPCGGVEPYDRTPLDAIKRELREETGYSSQNIIEICKLCANPANHTNTTYSYLALEAELTSQTKLDDTEDIEVVLLPINKVREMLYTNQFDQALHVSALFYALDYIKKLGI